MSWQATAYVKDLMDVSAYEKLLLFVLADYHNTHRGAAWPSVPSLAAEALMTERNCFRLLKQLEKGREGHPEGILRRRRQDKGRGALTEYVFVELPLGTAEKDDIKSSLSGAKGEPKGDAKGEWKGDSGDIAIRKERKNERTKEQNQDPPYPPFSKGGLSDRDRRRISKWVDQLFEDDRRASTQGARSPKRTWSEVLELACADLMLPLDRARRSLCEDDVWRCRLGVESVVGASA